MPILLQRRTAANFPTNKNDLSRNTSKTTCAGTTSTAYNNSTGRVTSRTDAENRTTTYTYDAMGRKLTTTYPDSSVRNYSNMHELTSVAGTSQTFDNDGNLTAAHTGAGFSWNDANRTSGSTLGTLTTTYKHDASGVRVSKKVVDGSTTTVDTVYVHAGPNCIAEYNYSAASSSPAMEYVYAQEIDSLALIARNNNAQKLIVTRNQQWSVVSLCDNANGDVLERYTYDQFGKRKILAPDGSTVRTTSSYDNSWGYTSRYHDAESGFMYFRARYYDPTTGEFTSRDPLEYVDGLSLFRAYLGFAGTDPFGLYWKPLGNDIWQSIGDGNLLRDLADQVSHDPDDWSCIWPIAHWQEPSLYPLGVALDCDRVDVSNLTATNGPSLIANMDGIYSWLGVSFQTSRPSAEWTPGGDSLFSSIQRRSNQGATPIDYFEFFGHSGNVPSIAVGEEAMNNLGFIEDRKFEPGKYDPNSPAVTYARGILHNGPQRCWFTRNAKGFAVACMSEEFGKAFSERFLRDGGAWIESSPANVCVSCWGINNYGYLLDGQADWGFDRLGTRHSSLDHFLIYDPNWVRHHGKL